MNDPRKPKFEIFQCIVIVGLPILAFLRLPGQEFYYNFRVSHLKLAQEQTNVINMLYTKYNEFENMVGMQAFYLFLQEISPGIKGRVARVEKN